MAEATEEADPEKKSAELEAAADGILPPAKKSKKKLIIIIVAALVVLGGGAGGAYYAGLFGKGGGEHAAAGTELGPDGKPVEKPVFYTMPEFLVNLNGNSKQPSFLKAVVILEVRKEDVPQVESNLPRMVDALNTYLRELRPSDLTGSAGIQRLREELLTRANKTLSPVKVGDVLFKEIVVQ